MNEEAPVNCVRGNMDLLKLTWYMDQGAQGTDDDPSNPLSRAVNRLFEDGQPFGRIALCLFGDLAPRSIRCSPLRWLGAFILSAGERVIFFPGFANTPGGIQSFQGQLPQLRHDDQAFEVDHVSLERDRTKCHFTTYKSKAHVPRSGGFPTCPLGDERFLWFGLRVAREAELRELKAETIVTAYTPPNDSRRRAEVFKHARDGAEYLWASLHPEARGRFQEGCLHFAVIVGPKGFSPYEGAQLGLPFGSPFLSEPLPPDVLEKPPVRVHRLSLGSSTDIQLVTMWLPGSLRVPFSFTS